jgi:uncharacterized protein YoxC
MSTVANVSLAIIAATCIISAGAFIVFLVYLWRVLARVESMLMLVHRSLPGLVSDSRSILTKIDRDILGELVRAVTHVTTVVGTGVSAVEHVQSTARRVTQSVILPQMATAIGLLSAIREGLTWFRPAGDGKRR